MNRPSVRLYLASTNPGKLREFRLAANARGIAVEPLPGIQDLPPCVEDGDTFEANAVKKALHYAALTRGLVFADDSGISVGALGGAPGVFSARFAGPQATDVENNQKLLRELAKVAERKQQSPRMLASASPSNGFLARYVCVIALADDSKIRHIAYGEAAGLIIETARGAGGFGYDPYFFYPPLGRTFAELSADEKFAVSHRGIAFRKLLDALVAREGKS